MSTPGLPLSLIHIEMCRRDRGRNVSLSKEAPGLSSVTVGLGWDARVTDGADFDLDASVFICGENGKIRSDADFIFYNNKIGLGGAVEHLGDNKTGAGEGDDEAVKIDLTKICLLYTSRCV